MSGIRHCTVILWVMIQWNSLVPVIEVSAYCVYFECDTAAPSTSENAAHQCRETMKTSRCILHSLKKKKKKRNSMKFKYILVLVIMFVIITTYYYAYILEKLKLSSSQVMEFLHLNILEDKKFYQDNCFESSFVPTLDKLESNLKKWSNADNRKCQILWKKFQTIYIMEQREGTLFITSPFSNQVKLWLGNNETLYNSLFHQPIISIRNLFTREETVFNLLRSKRPSDPVKENYLLYVERMSNETKHNCNFCSYNKNTAEDLFGRIKGKFSVSASNVFKLEKWHGMVLSKSHNPLNISVQEFLDLFNTTLKWFAKAHSMDSSSSYPTASFDMLPKGGASQFHPHVHTFLSPHYMDHMRYNLAAAQEYSKSTGGNMWQDLLEIHCALDLGVIFGDAVAISPLTPQREYEVFVLSNRPGKDLFLLFYYVLRTYYDVLERPCFSAGMAYPYMLSEGQTRREDMSLPAIIRVGTRGKCSSQTSDLSSLDLYVIRNIQVDSYIIINKLKEMLNKYDGNMELPEEMVNLYEDSALH